MSTAARPRPSPGLADALHLSCQVIGALMLRETKTRFGRYAGGYLWAIAEPVLFIIGLMLLRGLLGRDEGLAREGGASEAPVFFAAGVLTFLLFRNLVQRAMAATSANRGLLLHAAVTPLDAVLARVLLEAATSLVVLCIVIALIPLIWGQPALPASPLGLLAVLGTAVALGLALGLLLGAAATVWPVTERIVAGIQRGLFFVSGVFFVPAGLPPALRDALLWNPLLHLTEAARMAWMIAPPEQFGTLAYPLLLAWLLLPFGLAAERLARRRVAFA